MIKFLLTPLVIGLLSIQAIAKTVYTHSLDEATVQGMVNGTTQGWTAESGGTQTLTVVPGDVLMLPGGTADWSTAVFQLNKNITLQGKSGVAIDRKSFSDGTVITSSLANTVINMVTTADIHTACLSGITLTASGSHPIAIGGSARFNPLADATALANGAAGGFRVTNCHFKGGNGGSDYVRFNDWVTGVVDHCFLDIPSDASGEPFTDINMPAMPGYLGGTTAVAGTTSTALTTSGNAIQWTGHGLKEAQGVMFSGTLPSGLSTNVVYYVLAPSTNSFSLSATPFASAITFSNTSTQFTGTPTKNVPRFGVWSYAMPWNWGNDFSGIYIEDCILQRNSFLIKFADGPPAASGGGARAVVRHGNQWGGTGPHGFDESGGNVGAAAIESYNNVLYTSHGTSPASHNIRAGGFVCFNERYIAYNQPNNVGYASFNRAASQGTTHIVGPGDGSNVFDLNARGGDYSYTYNVNGDSTYSYTPRETTISSASNGATLPQGTINITDGTSINTINHVYINSTVSGHLATQDVTCTGKNGTTQLIGCSGGTGTLSTGYAVVGPLVIAANSAFPGGTYAPVSVQADGTSPGVPADTRIGAVYAQGTNGVGTGGPIGPAGTTGNSPPYQLNGFDGSGAANKWAGFSFRNRTGSGAEGGQADGGGSPAYPCSVITSSSSDGTNTKLNILGPHDQCKSTPCESVQTLKTSDNWEFRFLVNGIGFPGSDTGFPLMDGALGRNSFYVTVNGQNKYWPAKEFGIWYWNVFSTASAATARAGTGITASTFGANNSSPIQSVGRLMNGGLHNGGSSKPSGLTYPSQPADRAHLRIGADWDSGTYGGVTSAGASPNGILPTTIEYDSSLDGSTTNNPVNWPATWRATAAYGSAYPHPLVSGSPAPTPGPTVTPTPTPTPSPTPTATPTPTPPAFTSATSTTFIQGVQNSFDVTITAQPVTTISETGTLPAGITFSNIGNNTAQLAGTTTDTAQDYALTFKASNASGNASQNFTLTVATPTPTPSSSPTPPGAITFQP